jgi:regulatory protein
MTDEQHSPDEPAAETVNPRDVRLAAMDLLARREHLQQELQQKLGKRFQDRVLVADVVGKLRDDGLQSDQRYCESYVQARSGRGYGPDRIRMEMCRKGAATEMADQALQDSEVDWGSLARNTRRKKFGPAIPEDFKEQSRQMRFLQYRGFSGDTLRRALRFEDE